MRVQGFINVYPKSEVGAQGTTYGEYKTGDGIFTTLNEANATALPSRLAVAEFGYEKVSYVNVYKGNPWNAFDAAITLGHGMYESEEVAQIAVDAVPVWVPFHIGIVKLKG